MLSSCLMAAIHQRCRPELVLFCSPGKTEFLLTKSCKRTATTTCKIFPHRTPIHGGILTSTLGPQSAFPSYPWRGKSQATWWAAPHTSAAGGLWYQLAVQLRSLLPLTGGLLPATDWWTGRETPLLNFTAGPPGLHEQRHHFLPQTKKRNEVEVSE